MFVFLWALWDYINDWFHDNVVVPRKCRKDIKRLGRSKCYAGWKEGPLSQYIFNRKQIIKRTK